MNLQKDTSSDPSTQQLALPKAGDRITLRKIEVKDGKKSKVKVGKIVTGTLAKSMTIGHPPCLKNENRPQSYYGATSEIVGAEKIEGVIRIETKTSIYILC